MVMVCNIFHPSLVLGDLLGELGNISSDHRKFYHMNKNSVKISRIFILFYRKCLVIFPESFAIEK